MGLVDGIYTSDFTLDGWRHQAQADAFAGQKPKPPLRPECCQVYWESYRATVKEMTKGRKKA